jgi:hypothetical protein
MRSAVLGVLAVVGCGGAVPPAPVATAAPSMATRAADGAELTGAWTGADWGAVSIDGNVGSYTDTYGTGPGRLELRKTGDHTYSGTWSESAKRHGTMRMLLSEDGASLSGLWFVDADSTIGSMGGGALRWKKQSARAAGDAGLDGTWTGADWGTVTFAGGVGSYTDTYGTGPGRLQLERMGDHTYAGVWGESTKRHGTLTVTLSKDASGLTGTWYVDPDCTIGKKGGGPIRWTKK